MIRSYANMLLLENLLDVIPDPEMERLCDSIVAPYVLISEEDCGTSLGEKVEVLYSMEGKIEIETGLPMTKDRIEYLLSRGVYYTYVKSSSTCISKEGICRKCLAASYPSLASSAIGSRVKIPPKFCLEYDWHIYSGYQTFPMSPEGAYDYVEVFANGEFVPSSKYSITNTILMLSTEVTSTLVEGTSAILINYISSFRIPYMYWLADSYSGAALGVRPLSHPRLPLKGSTYSASVPLSVIDTFIDGATELEHVPKDVIEYLPKIEDAFEKALLTISVYSFNQNVSANSSV